MKINLMINSYNSSNNKKTPSFKNRDYFLKIKGLPNNICACCGKKVINADTFVRQITPLSKPLSFVMEKGKLNYLKKYYPEAWETLLDFSQQYPQETLDRILDSKENYVRLKINIANKLENPNLEENTKERHYLDRKIGGRFFDLLCRARSSMLNSSEVMTGLSSIKPYLDGLKKEVFEKLEEYSKIYPDKTLREIVEEVHEFHDERAIEFRDQKYKEIEQIFKNIKNIFENKSPNKIEISNILEEETLKILKNERDPEARKYKIEQLFTKILTENKCKKLLPNILNEANKMPISTSNVDSFFSFAYHKNFDDEKIIRSIFNPYIASEEHIKSVAENGADRIGNKVIMCKECNDLRRVSYKTFLTYHPEMIVNSQKQMNKITDDLLNNVLSEDYRFYPFSIAQTFLSESEGIINLDLTSYAKKMLIISKEKLADFDKEIESLSELRDVKVYEMVKYPEQKNKISEELNEINQKMKVLKTKIWTERNLQTIITDYLKGKNK